MIRRFWRGRRRVKEGGGVGGVVRKRMRSIDGHVCFFGSCSPRRGEKGSMGVILRACVAVWFRAVCL
jgi:hypothetical protein